MFTYTQRKQMAAETRLQPLTGERQKGESDNAVAACNDWLRMGTGRTLVDLHEKYTNNHQDSPPTGSIGTLKRWSSSYKWADRAVDYDANYEDLKNKQRAAVMNYGAALDFDRVARLKRLADFLEAQIFAQDENQRFENVWLKDEKSIGPAGSSKFVDIERFNAPLISEYRATLDDIAKEVGDRIKKSDLTSNGETITFQITYDDDTD